MAPKRQREGGGLEHTVLGHIRIEGRELVASVNLHNWAKRIRAEIERRLTHHVRYKATDMPDSPGFSGKISALDFIYVISDTQALKCCSTSCQNTKSRFELLTL